MTLDSTLPSILFFLSIFQIVALTKSARTLTMFHYAIATAYTIVFLASTFWLATSLVTTPSPAKSEVVLKVGLPLFYALMIILLAHPALRFTRKAISLILARISQLFSQGTVK